MSNVFAFSHVNLTLFFFLANMTLQYRHDIPVHTLLGNIKFIGPRLERKEKVCQVTTNYFSVSKTCTNKFYI